MMKQLRATSERVQRSAARAASQARLEGGRLDAGALRMSNDMNVFGFGFAPFGGTSFANDATTAAWTVKPVHTTAICTNGKYHTRRLQEMLT